MYDFKVFKFGGASVKDASGVKNITKIIEQFNNDKLMVVISAMGKTTNALEEVVAAYFTKDIQQAHSLIVGIREKHYELIQSLFPPYHDVFNIVNDVFVEVEWVLDAPFNEDYDYIYDQIVCCGELVSTKIVSSYLNYCNIDCQWIDARDIIRTDETWREGNINWDITKSNVQKILLPQFSSHNLVISQGFLGGTSENETTTLGREGSDYSASIFSHCLDATSMTIWKDVPGVLNGDPRMFENVIKLDRLSYREAIEMTYYGASVIHPKTIKPLQNKNIPLFVRSFLDPHAAGTEISADVEDNYPPIVMVEKNQTLLHISTKDFSFVAEHHLSKVFGIIAKYRLFVNMMQNTAISFTVCMNNLEGRVDKLVKELETEFKVIREDNLELLTIRHFNDGTLERLKKDKIVLYEERISGTVQMVMRDAPIVTRKN